MPRGWADFGRQLAIWFGFLAAYQIARGVADRDPPRAFDNGLHVIGIERHAHALFELTLQRLVDGSEVLATLASWTYWNSEFTVLGLALLWVYLRRNEAFTRFRNTILLANVIGLVGYVLLPTAPPRMFPDLGFDDTLASFGQLNHGSGLDRVRGQPLRGDAEPARGRRADRRRRALLGLPSLVGEDDLAPLARLGLVQRDGDREPLLARRRRRRGRRPDRAPPRSTATRSAAVARPSNRLAAQSRRPPTVQRFAPREGASVGRVTRTATLAWVKQGYTDGTRRLASRWIGGLARTRVTPNALTAAGVTLCAVSAVLIWFGDHNQWLVYWSAAALFVVGSILDILDGALARFGGKATPFGAFLDSISDRVSEGFVLTAVALVFSRQATRSRSRSRSPRSAAPSSSPTPAPRRSCSACAGDVGFGSRAERVVVITAGLVFAPWGGLQWAIYFLAVTAWLTVLQRILHVRRELPGGTDGFDERQGPARRRQGPRRADRRRQLRELARAGRRVLQGRGPRTTSCRA